MKVFKVPEIEIVRFGKVDIVSSASCPTNCFCVDCSICPPGSNDCKWYDTCNNFCQRDNCPDNELGPN